MIPREILAKVRRIEIVTNRLVNETMGGSYHSTFKGRGMEFEEVREYAPGDEIRAIDWNVTARAGTPFVKVFREERELTALLMVDLSGSTDFGTAGATKGETAAELCALLAFSAVKNNDRVGLLAFTDRVEAFLPPKKGRNHALRLVRDVLTLRPEGRGTDIAGAADHAMRALGRRAVVFLVSDFAGGELPRRKLAALNKRHDLVAVRVNDRRETEMPDCGLVAFEDAETGRVAWIDTGDAAFRKRFAETAAAGRDATLKALRELKVDVADVETGKPAIDALVRLFRRRAGRY